jgi:hypothetical protein
MAATVLSGTSGALYYKPAGTTGTFASSGVNTANNEITVETFLNLKVGDPVQFSVVDQRDGSAGTGTLPAGIALSTTYYVIGYTASTGVLQVSATDGGSALAISDTGTVSSPNEFQVAYDSFSSVGQVRNWSFEISRSEIDVTTIGQTPGQFVPFREYIAGFADGSGSATVYMTNEASALGNRMVEDVIQRQQVGSAFKLYVDQVFNGSSVDDTKSRSIEFEAVLTSASLNVNPDDAVSVEINFRPAGAPTFDLSQS